MAPHGFQATRRGPAAWPSAAEDRLQGGAQGGRRGGDMDARALHGLDLFLGAALAASDDRPRMAHATARRRGEPGDEADRGFLDLGLLEELGGLFFRRAPDLADHDDGLGLGVTQEQVQAVDEVGAVDRIAADADAGGLTQVHRRGLRHGLVGQGPGAGYDTHAPRLVDVSGHDADLALAGGDDTGAVGSDQTGFGTAEHPLHLDHIRYRNALRDADHQRDLGIDRLQDGVGGEGWRHIDDGRIGAGLRDRLGYRVEDRNVQVPGAALAGGDAADHLGPIGDRLLGMKGPLGTGEALADDLGVFIDEN